MKLLELLGTLDDMVSASDVDNLKAEYQQTDIRARALENHEGLTDTEKEQLYYMGGYLDCLRRRLHDMGVDV